jgi:hypothetical protein
VAHTTWDVVMEPVGENGRPANESTTGIGIYLTANGAKKEMSRVAFVRRYAEAKSHKVKPFKRQLKEELEKAYDAAATMNAINANVQELRTQLDHAEREAASRLESLLRDAERRRDEALQRLDQGAGVLV